MNLITPASFLALLAYGEAYKYLGLFPFPVKSHFLWIEHFLVGLLDRGHELTVLTSFPMKNAHPNLTQILVEPRFDFENTFPKRELFKMKYVSSYWVNLNMYYISGRITTEFILNNSRVQDLIARDDLKFDAILAEQFYQEPLLMFAHKYKVPIVTIGTIGFADYMDRAMGTLTPWSFVPHTTLDYTDEMDFFERAFNTYISFLDMVLRYFKYYPFTNELTVKHFAQLEGKYGPLPSIEELEKKISFMLINSHPSTAPPRPLLPGQINVAGAHIHPRKPLPTNIKKFLDEANNGAIYFCLGSYIKGTDVPLETIKIFTDTFAKLKVRVLWKFEDTTLHVSKNVMLQNWAPQSDILAHPNVRLFITHGGMFGTQEGIHRGVPMLFMPFFGDQMRNALKATRAGYALTLFYKDFTKAAFYDAITELLTNKTYTKNAKEASVLFRDNKVEPLDEAVFWMEYVVRHNGAPHLESASRHLSWYQYLLLDVLLLFVVCVLLTIILLYGILKFVLSIIVNNSEIGKSKNKKQ